MVRYIFTFVCLPLRTPKTNVVDTLHIFTYSLQKFLDSGNIMLNLHERVQVF